jgi:putative membrane protein
MHYWFYGGHLIWMTIAWFVVIGIFFALVWPLFNAMSGSPKASSPEETLRQRYAAGEIDTEEYERRLEELSKTQSAA